jgi:hypothetical protein
VHRPTVRGVILRFFPRSYPLGRRIDVADDRLAAFGDVDMLDGHLLLAGSICIRPHDTLVTVVFTFDA